MPADPVRRPPTTHDGLLRRARTLMDAAAADGRRRVLGIAGAPGSGKTTLAAWLLTQLHRTRPGQAVNVGMDGFHLANEVLDEHGMVEIKGAPQTFDIEGYAALLRRLRTEHDHSIYAPSFHRDIEESIAQEIEIGPQVRLVVTEGNYLLLDDERWSRVRQLLDETWFVSADEDGRQSRLIARHEFFGLSHDHAIERSFGSDQRNADLVRRSSVPADVTIALTE